MRHIPTPKKKTEAGSVDGSGFGAIRRGTLPWLHVGALLFDEGADAFAEQGDVERLLEAFVEAVVDQAFRSSLILAGERDDHGLLVGWVTAQVAGDLQGLGAAHGKIDDDGIGVEAFGLDAGLETGVSQFVLE